MATNSQPCPRWQVKGATLSNHLIFPAEGDDISAKDDV